MKRQKQDSKASRGLTSDRSAVDIQTHRVQLPAFSLCFGCRGRIISVHQRGEPSPKGGKKKKKNQVFSFYFQKTRGRIHEASRYEELLLVVKFKRTLVEIKMDSNNFPLVKSKVVKEVGGGLLRNLKYTVFLINLRQVATCRSVTRWFVSCCVLELVIFSSTSIESSGVTLCWSFGKIQISGTSALASICGARADFYLFFTVWLQRHSDHRFPHSSLHHQGEWGVNLLDSVLPAFASWFELWHWNDFTLVDKQSW